VGGLQKRKLSSAGVTQQLGVGRKLDPVGFLKTYARITTGPGMGAGRIFFKRKNQESEAGGSFVKWVERTNSWWG